MNIFKVLRVNYEVFHSRMLHWLWTPEGDHGGRDRFWQPMRELLAIKCGSDLRIEDEVKIDVPTQQRWRLADLLIRTGDLLILVENKIDPAYQDAEQVADEIEGGKLLAAAEGRRFIYVFIAPGPLSQDLASFISANGGVFVPWSDMLNQLNGVPREGLDPFASETIRQYLEFATRPTKAAAPAASDQAVREAEQAIRGIVQSMAPGSQLTAVDVWTQFTTQFPDHVAALDARWAGAKHYSAKSWFASKLLRMAVNNDLIEDIGIWQASNASEWGFPKVRVYQRVVPS